MRKRVKKKKTNSLLNFLPKEKKPQKTGSKEKNKAS